MQAEQAEQRRHQNEIIAAAYKLSRLHFDALTQEDATAAQAAPSTWKAARAARFLPRQRSESDWDWWHRRDLEEFKVLRIEEELERRGQRSAHDDPAGAAGPTGSRSSRDGAAPEAGDM
jgi:hypothetical protein